MSLTALSGKWYEKAAAKGFAAAMNNLGDLYYYGRGVEQDYRLAAKWFEKSAANDFAIAMYNLGNLYKNGYGVTQDYALAKKLYRSLTENIDEEVSDDEARVIRVQQIYVTDADTAQLIKEKLANGDDFAAVASTYNKASEIETVVARDEYPQEVENIAFNLDNGAISDMIEANGGYYFIKCLNKLEEQLTEDNKENIRQKRRMELFDHEYQDFIDQATFTMNDSLWDDIHLEETEEITTDSFFQIYDKCFKEE